MLTVALWLSRRNTKASPSYGSTGTTGCRSPSLTNFPASCVPPHTPHPRPSDRPTKSQFGIDEWKYLTTDQALEDFAVFAKGFTLPSASRIKLSSADALQPEKTPWVVIGASYPGVRAALLRVRNPEVVFASWSSSAPVQAQINMASYFQAVERALPRNCSSDWVAVTKYVDGVLMGTNSTEQLRVKRALYVARMSGPNGNTTLVQPLSDSDVLSIPSDQIAGVLMDPLINFQVGSSLTTIFGWYLSPSRGLVCKPSCRSATTWRRAIPGIVLHRKAFSSIRVSMSRSTRSWPPSPKSIMTPCSEVMVTTILLMLYAFFPSLAPHSPIEPGRFLQYSWTWQYCSEFGYYQVSDPNNPVNIESTYYTLAEQQTWCDQTFSNANPRQPNVTAVNKYGGWDMSPSNVFFSNGECEPLMINPPCGSPLKKY